MQHPSFAIPEQSKLVAAIDESPGPKFQSLLKKHKISNDEYRRIRDIIGRAPTLAELGVFSAMWSEHCSYKSSRVHLKRFPTQGPAVVVGPGENAGVVRLSGKLCIAFKMESHNHPSYIEPYQGAATGVGGILRDVFCMGARPVANLNALRFGSRSHPRTSYLREYVVKGIGDYGNCVGIPTISGNISYDPSYNGNCLVNAMTVGMIHEDRIFKGYASGRGNLVVYVGSATGRDGIHGATMASDSFATKSDSERSTVQVGDPFKEKLLLEATLEVLDKGLVVGLQDMGAAGLTSSSFEMAGRAGNGLLIDLDQVPIRTTNMTAYELLLSESQERMLMVVEPHRWPELKTVLDRWLLENAVIGVVTDTGRVQVLYNGNLEADLPVAPMTDEAPKYDRPQRPRRRDLAEGEFFDRKVADAIIDKGSEQLLLDLMKSTGDKLPIFEQYDHHIGNRTVHGPEDQGAGVLWMRSNWADPAEPYLGLAVTATCNERYCRLDPRAGASHGVLKSARMIAATGGHPLAITDCLNFGNPEVPEVMWELSQAVDGISDACRELAIPVVSGNVSLYNETDGVSIAPTPMIGMVGKIRDVRYSPKAVIDTPSQLFLLMPHSAQPVFGGSLAAQALGFPAHEGHLPEIKWESELEAMSFLQKAAAAGWLSACRDVGNGGILLTAAKMVVGQNLGLAINLDEAPFAIKDSVTRYFGELACAYLLALTEDGTRLACHEARRLKHCSLTLIGRVDNGAEIAWGAWRCPKQQLREAFCAAHQLE